MASLPYRRNSHISCAFLLAFLARKRSDVINHIPQFGRLDPISLWRHFPFAILDDVKQFAIRFVLQCHWISPIAYIHLFGRRDLSLALAILPVAHRAIITVVFLALRK